MIKIIDKQNCCGCTACVQTCPVHCIEMREDKEGFLYPEADDSKCIECGLCEQVCPFLNDNLPRSPQKVFAAKSKDDYIRLDSSSGGVFSLLAGKVIEEGGVVFGVKFDECWQPVFTYVESMDQLAPLRGSKYVQAIVGTAFSEARAFLRQGRKVLFSGTSCQVAALKRFLRQEYVNLLTVDVVCHGVPSPLVWRQYLQEIRKSDRREDRGKNTVLSSSKEISVITGISFRDKKLGWKKYRFVVRGKSAEGGQNSVLLSAMHRINPFLQAFLSNMILRDSCYNCKVKSGKSCSDVTIADYWGVSKFHPEMDDDKGTSLVLAYTIKGLDAVSTILQNCEYVESDYKYGLYANPCIERSVKVPKYRSEFWKEFSIIGIDAITPIYNRLQPGLIKKSYLFLRHALKRSLQSVGVIR